MNVLHLISSEGYYGAEAMLIALARETEALGFHAVVGAFHDHRQPPTEVADRARESGLPVETIPCRGRWDWTAVQRLREILNRHSVDVLHAHGYKADFYGYLAARGGCAALLSTCHNWPCKQPLMRAYAVLDRRILRQFHRVIAVSDTVADTLRRSGLPLRKLATIPNGVDVSAFTGALPSLGAGSAGEQRRLVGFVGRLVPGKGGDVLLRAAQQVVAAHADAVFVFAGEGPLRSDWEALAARLGIARNVVFLGIRSDMAAVYASLEMLVLPSFEEAASMCVLEAMAAGKPVIATRVGALPEMIIPEVTGILVEPGDIGETANAVLRLLRDRDLAFRMGENARQYIARNGSARVMVLRYLEQYREALAARLGRGPRMLETAH